MIRRRGYQWEMLTGGTERVSMTVRLGNGGKPIEGTGRKLKAVTGLVDRQTYTGGVWFSRRTGSGFRLYTLRYSPRHQQWVVHTLVGRELRTVLYSVWSVEFEATPAGTEMVVPDSAGELVRLFDLRVGDTVRLHHEYAEQGVVTDLHYYLDQDEECVEVTLSDGVVYDLESDEVCTRVRRHVG